MVICLILSVEYFLQKDIFRENILKGYILQGIFVVFWYSNKSERQLMPATGTEETVLLGKKFMHDKTALLARGYEMIYRIFFFIFIAQKDFPTQQ